MPKHEILHPAGTPIEQPLRAFMEHFFGVDLPARLERLGGKVAITVAAPFMEKKKGAPEAVVDKTLVAALRELRDRPSEIKIRLAALPIKKLRELAKLIEHPVRTKSTRNEVVEELARHFHGEEVWSRISRIDGKPKRKSAKQDHDPSA